MNSILTAISEGLLVGVILSLPLGATGFVILRRSVLSKWRRAYASALAPMTIDALAVTAILGYIQWTGEAPNFKWIEWFLPFLFYAAGFAFIHIGNGMLRHDHSKDEEDDYLSTLKVVRWSIFTIVIGCAWMVPYFGSQTIKISGAHKILFYDGCFLGEVLTWTLEFMLLWGICRLFRISFESVARFFAVGVIMAGVIILCEFLT